MNWSIDAEWYDPQKHTPPTDESVLCLRRGISVEWNEREGCFGETPCLVPCVGSYDEGLWFVEGDIDYLGVVAWTWLPKMPNVGMVEHEEND